MTLSARNQLKGTVKGIVLGEVMAEVQVELPSGDTVVAAITRRSVESLELKAGDEVRAIVKATEVMIDK